MKRLTKRELIHLSHGEEVVNCNYDSEECNDSCMKIQRCKWYEKAMKRLKAYEDTGLTPEEVKYMQKDYEKKVCTGCWLKDEKEVARQIQSLKTRYQDGMDVHYQGDDESDGIECPLCGWEVARNDDFSEMRPEHCPKCGTKLIY